MVVYVLWPPFVFECLVQDSYNFDYLVFTVLNKTVLQVYVNKTISSTGLIACSNWYQFIFVLNVIT